MGATTHHRQVLTGSPLSARVAGFMAPGFVKSIQTGLIAMANLSVATATIAAVQVANTLPYLNGSKNAIAAAIVPSNGLVRLGVTNATTITVTRAANTADAFSVAFTALEFQLGVLRALQSGTITLTGAGVLSATATIASIDTTKSACYPTGWTSDGDNASPTGENFLMTVLTNATTVTASKSLAGGAYTNVGAYTVATYY